MLPESNRLLKFEANNVQSTEKWVSALAKFLERELKVFPKSGLSSKGASILAQLTRTRLERTSRIALTATSTIHQRTEKFAVLTFRQTVFTIAQKSMILVTADLRLASSLHLIRKVFHY